MEEKTSFRPVDNLIHDIPASLVVFLVALPLCLGIALASGAPLFSGLVAGITGGIVGGFLSKSPISVAGPAAGLTSIVIASIAELGSFPMFLTCVVIAGLIQIADGECQLARQRRIRPELAKMVAAGKRVVRTRFWIDPEVCTGDHSCIRLSGCPSLTIKPNEDPLRTDPVAHVNNDCVGCGLCGEVADAAVLCPSFYKADIVQNPTWWDRLVWRVRSKMIGAMAC